MPDLFRSKKFQAALIGLVVAITGHYGLDLSSEAIWAVLSPILVYIGAQGLADALPGKEKAMMEAAYRSMRLPEISGEIEIEEREWPSNRPT